MTEGDHHRIIRALTEQSGIVVLGPGCRRIGAGGTSDDAWAEVTTRVRRIASALAGGDEDGQSEEQEFLSDFWRGIYSDDERRLHPPGEVTDPMTTLSEDSVETWRTMLAVPVLRAIRSATQALGNSIGTGRTVVSDWERVVVVGTADNELTAAATTTRDNLAEAADTACVLLQVLGGPARLSERQKQLARRLLPGGLQQYEANQQLKRRLPLFKLDAVAEALNGTLARSFPPGEASRLDGATVEWLSSLLRHLLFCDSTVPPSQAELAFFVNLTSPYDMPPKGVRRPRSGQYLLEAREPGEARELLADDINTLLRHRYPAPGAGTAERRRFMLTIAATLRANWEYQRQIAVESEDNVKKLPIAFVLDYDLAFEQALLRVTPEPSQEWKREGFHVLVPVWAHRFGARAVSVEWLFGTLERNGFGGMQAASDCTWQWLCDVPYPAPGKLPIGPVVIKLNGSPLHRSGANTLGIEPSRLGLPAKHHLYADDPISPAVILSESRQLQVISSFPFPGWTQNEDSFIPWLMGPNGLGWASRAWLYLGMGFTDYLARVRLFYDTVGHRTDPLANESKWAHHLAVDREFTWPEERLLEALGVRAIESRLEKLTGYPADSAFLVGDAARVSERVAALVAKAGGRL